MAAYISFQPTDFFSPKIYAGSASAVTVTGLDFQPDVTWTKDRQNTGYHALIDSVRGAGKYLQPDNTSAQSDVANNCITSFTSDGFVTGTAAPSNNSSSSGIGFISWNWKAGTTTGLSGGTITPTGYSINTTSGFGVYEYTGTNVNATIAHGLGVAPKMVIVKRKTSGSSWMVQHNNLTSADYILKLDTTASESDDSANFNGTAPDATVFNLGTSNNTNKTGDGHMAYVFAPIKGYSAFGKYLGNGNVDGTFVYTGFRPAFVMAKYASPGGGVGDWNMYDDKRKGYNDENDYLAANSTSAENSSDNQVDLLSNGFKWRATDSDTNESGSTYVYMAFAEFPFVSSNSKAGVAR